MARKIVDVTIDDEGRDHGKMFKIYEMDACSAEWWGYRALLALGRAGATATQPSAGLAGFAAEGFDSLMNLTAQDAKPLLDEMLACVKYVHKQGSAPQTIMQGAACQIDEVKTLLRLRREVIEIHLGFSIAGMFQRSPTIPAPAKAA